MHAYHELYKTLYFIDFRWQKETDTSSILGRLIDIPPCISPNRDLNVFFSHSMLSFIRTLVLSLSRVVKKQTWRCSCWDCALHNCLGHLWPGSQLSNALKSPFAASPWGAGRVLLAHWLETSCATSSYTGRGSDYSFCSRMKSFVALGKHWILGTTVEFCNSSRKFHGGDWFCI